jgi:Tol biopolymer transport system component/predicted Ser/Thr protein kinase
MALSAGTHLGPYEILAPLGAGGMGEVYRARDPRMGRDVAIKLAAERFSDRFDREVRAVAALNHANICQVYDVGPNYLVMELVEGPTLADRIKAGALPLEEALTISRQIGDALEAAHEKGIIHRDLKPANIKIKPDGVVKVLDFGLAKIAEASAAAVSPEESPTIPMGATLAGQIMGTAAYMAPEQARGKPVDKRADIWAFGVVLYEMLTGHRLFEGETISDILAGVLTREPDWERVPAEAQRLVKSCLEKDPKRRLRDVGDAWRLLDDAPASTIKAGLLWKVGTGVLAAALALALWAPWRAAVRPIDQPPKRLDLDLGPNVSFGTFTGPAVILSPDGTRLVFVSQGESGIRHLFTRGLDEPKAIQMQGTEGAYAPFYSPDGQWVGFFALGKLKKTRIDGGEPISLCDAPTGRGGSWAENGSIIAALDQQYGLSQVPVEGGKPVPVTKLNREAGEYTHRWPQVLPGGTVLFIATAAYGNFEYADIAIMSLKDHQRKSVLQHAGMYARYLPSGHLIYVTKGALFAMTFDLDRLQVRGAATRLWEVANNPNLGFAEIDFSRNGTLAYRTGGSGGHRTFQWLDTGGKMAPLGIEPAYYQYCRLSPDGSRVAYVMNQESNQELWTYDFERGIRIRLTNGQYTSYPTWSVDGRFLVYQAIGGMFWTRADGAGKPQPLTHSTNTQLPGSFTPDGTRLAFSQHIPEVGGEIRIAPIAIDSGQLRAGESQLFIQTTTGTVFPAFSPDGRWLAYADAAGGRYEVYVRSFPDNGTQVQVSNAGGLQPIWSRNGHELFYRTEDQRIMVANYTVKGNSFVADKPRLWFLRQLANIGLGGNYDVAADGKRLIALMLLENPAPRDTQNHVKFVLNFYDEVRRRVAGK